MLPLERMEGKERLTLLDARVNTSVWNYILTSRWCMC